MAAPILVISGPSGGGKSTVAALLARSFDRSVHLPADAFMPFVVNGWTDPWLEEAGQQNEVMGAAVGSAAIQFALGGYTVLLDGGGFPDGVEGLAEFASRRDVALHYVILRPDLQTCLDRIEQRRTTLPAGQVEPAGRSEYVGFLDPDALARQYARFSNLGDYEAVVFTAMESPEQMAKTILAAVSTGQLLIRR